MTKINSRIEIVRSSNKGFISLGLKSAMSMQSLLRRHYASVRITSINNPADLAALVARQPDLVFNGVNYVPADPDQGFNSASKIWVAKYLSEQGIAFTGSCHPAHILEFNKDQAKHSMQDNNINTAKFAVIKHGELPSRTAVPLTYPVFIKPSNRGGGVGIDNDSLAKNYEALEIKVASLSSKLQADSLIEEYLPGREFSVAILKDEFSKEYSAMPLELIAPVGINGERVLTAEVKVADTEEFIAITDMDLKETLAVLALDIFHTLGARDYGRVDLRMDKDDNLHFIEANLIPSLLNNYSNFMKACMLNAGLGYEDAILRIVRLGLQRSSKPEIPKFIPVLDDSLAIVV